jgi:hypothetical protein
LEQQIAKLNSDIGDMEQHNKVLGDCSEQVSLWCSKIEKALLEASNR